MPEWTFYRKVFKRISTNSNPNRKVQKHFRENEMTSFFDVIVQIRFSSCTKFTSGKFKVHCLFLFFLAQNAKLAAAMLS